MADPERFVAAEGRRFRPGATQPAVEQVQLVVEEPLAIQLDSTLVATTMRTPGQDFALAAGYCHAEGLLAGYPVTDVRYCTDDAPAAGDFATVNVETWGKAPKPTQRLGLTSSSCGVCGSEVIAELADLFPPVPPSQPVSAAVVAEVLGGLGEHQDLFGQTGGAHVAVAFDSTGNVVVAAEDIGRHNAVDKVVGQLLLAGQLPATGLGLLVSSRASFEIVQKAWAGGFGLVVAVSAASALAVETAQAANITLAAFARHDRVTYLT